MIRLRKAAERGPVVERYFRAVEIAPPGEKDAVQIVSRVKGQFRAIPRCHL